MRRCVEQARTRLHDHMARGEQCGRRVGAVVLPAHIRKIRASRPGAVRGVIDIVVADGAEIDDVAVGPQHRGAKLVTAGVDQLLRRFARAAPRSRREVVDFDRVGVRAEIGIGVDDQDVAVRQLGPSLLIVGIVLPRTRGGPTHGGAADRGDRLLRAAAIREHVAAVGQDHALGIADAAPSGRRRDRRPGIGDGIIQGALVGPDGAAGVVFAAVDDHAAVREDFRCKEEGLIAARHRGNRIPGAFLVLALLVGRQLVPVGRTEVVD